MEIVVDFEKPVLFSFEFKVKVTSPNISMSYLGFKGVYSEGLNFKQDPCHRRDSNP